MNRRSGEVDTNSSIRYSHCHRGHSTMFPFLPAMQHTGCWYSLLGLLKAPLCWSHRLNKLWSKAETSSIHISVLSSGFRIRFCKPTLELITITKAHTLASTHTLSHTHTHTHTHAHTHTHTPGIRTRNLLWLCRPGPKLYRECAAQGAE